MTDLQKIVNLCVTELALEGLSVQANKSALICLGRAKKYRTLSIKIYINNVLLESSKELRCLGVHFNAGQILKFNFDHCKAKFYNAANAILAHVGNRPDLLLPLCNAQCVTILLYNVESMSLTNTEKTRLAHPYFRIFAKLFNTFDTSLIKQCHWYMGCMPLEYVIDLRTIKFCDKLVNSSNHVLKTICMLNSYDEMLKLKSKYGIDKNPIVSWRTMLWRHFELSIDV